MTPPKEHPCYKQTVLCVIVRDDGQTFAATNSCCMADETYREAEICKRSALSIPSGEGYDFCNSTHAEVAAAELAEDSKDIPGSAFLFGHSYMCQACQEALQEINVNRFQIMSEDVEAAVASIIVSDELLESVQ